ncbi:MAG: CHAD domain-containing protein [Xanthomonadales bacterium]|nr:CHAD domain-containing protein [Xanthomonadales bacterium]
MPGLPIRAYATDQLLRAFACMGWRGRRVHEGVHQARKSMRRVRACLALAGFDATGEGKRIDRDLARQCRALSQLRDAQARIETIDRLIETHAPGDAATLLRRVRRSALQERSQQLQRSVAADAGFSEQREQLRALATRLDALPWATLSEAQLQAALQHSLKRCRKAEARAVRRRRRRLASLAPAPTSAAAATHRARRLRDRRRRRHRPATRARALPRRIAGLIGAVRPLRSRPGSAATRPQAAGRTAAARNRAQAATDRTLAGRTRSGRTRALKDCRRLRRGLCLDLRIVAGVVAELGDATHRAQRGDVVVRAVLGD